MPRNDVLEHDIQNEIRIWCGEHDVLAIRINVGTFKTLYGDRTMNAGPPKGWPDLQLFDKSGHIVFCECKARYGRVREEQAKVHAELRRRGFVVIVPKSFDDFVKEISKYEWFN